MADALCWLYVRLVGAARQGQLQLLAHVFSFLTWKVKCHILLEAAKHGHLELVKYLVPRYPNPLKIEYIDEQLSSLKLNAMEVAAFQGQPKVIRLLIENIGTYYPFRHVREGIMALVRAVNRCNTSVVEALEIALFSMSVSYVMSEVLKDSTSDAFNQPAPMETSL
jgi:hypothetical protein